ncbi:RAB6A-GEF complex partner protein 2 [Rhynchospora pubera]|uniref:RAB6A-GEF complex partner protein 2 n=1 Tax=Rhynchospora pubera TaxID=906938 RepID=A0AAV8C0V8_9POAL|nr:RAB6A-GEF complex partner protein 2 [Rhynchospora pubera]
MMSISSLIKSVVWGEQQEENKQQDASPSLKLTTDKDAYRPGEPVIVTIDISNPRSDIANANANASAPSLFLDALSFQLQGLEKLDTQWFATSRPMPSSRHKRGENVFLDSLASSLLSKVILSSATTKTYILRVDLPKLLPPSYRGTSIRYIYYVRATLYASFFHLDTDHQNNGPTGNSFKLEARAPLQIWVPQKCMNLLSEEGNLPVITDQLPIYWKEKDEDSEWTRVNENDEDTEEGYDSSRDEVSSISSYNPANANNFEFSSFRNSLSNQSFASARLSAGSAFPPYRQLPQLSVSEIVEEAGPGIVSPQRKLSISLSNLSSNVEKNSLDFQSNLSKEDVGPPFTPRYLDPASSEDFIKGRSYNIKIDDNVLLRFSPKNSDSTYYFGDMIGGTLTFFHEDAIRQCLEVSVSLEMSESINQKYIHPSRRVSPTITKVHSEHHEVVADIRQTSFLFSVPIDGPITFSTPKVSVQWSLKFEFYTTPEGLDISRYEHPLLIERREKGEWVLPITVYAPPLRRQAVQSRNDKHLSLGNLFIS